jgi:hypothetical protein
VEPLAPAPFVPPFVEHFELRPTGPMPFSGAAEAAASGWVRPRDPGLARDAAYVTALADVWWPALYARLPRWRPMATVAFTLDLVDGCDGLPPDAPLYHRARVVAARGGYVVEQRELWGDNGRLVALNQQTFVVIQ